MHITKKLLLFTALSLGASLAGAGTSTRVFLDGSELNYVGDISQDGNKELFELYAALEKKPAMLSIRSPGGVTDSGLALGTWVHKQGMTVKVLEYCLSSCANYVFTAAPKKIVSNFAVIGYHGGLSSKSFAIDEEQEARFAAMPEAERIAARKLFDEEVKQLVAAKEQGERDFFALIKVDQRITTLGQSPEYAQRFEKDKHSLGWTFSMDGFNKLGVSHIQVINPPWRPRFINSAFTFHQIDLK